jgi:hypothetical protein
MEAASRLDQPSGAADRSAMRLRDGRSLTVVSADTGELIEVRSAEGTLELRLRMTDEGPVLEMESVRLKLRAAESVEIETKDFNVSAERSMGLSSQGEITVSGEADVHVDAAGGVHVTGEMIYLN